MEAYLDFPWAPDGHTGRLGFGAPNRVISASSVQGVVPALRAVEAAARSGRYAVGFVSYEASPAFDPAMRVRGGSGVPLVWFGIHDAPLAPTAWREPTAYSCSVWEPGTAQADYIASIAAIRAAIARGETYQVNHTMRLRARFDGDPLGAWADLRRAQRDGWFGYVDTGRHTVASVSPELFFTWDGATVVTRPMKGTRARSRDATVDAARAADLLDSAKDRAENLMIVDLLRNDVARVSEPGSVSVPRLFEVEAYPTVWQMTSTVTGVARIGLGVSDIFQALFPCGSITGAPKVRTMELISEFEDRPRGVYCGAVGVVWPGGSAAFNVAIRTLVVDREDGRARYDVGGGVVWDSDGADEYAEALAKSAVLDMTQRSFALIETARWQDGAVVLEDRHLDRMAASAACFGRPFDRAAARTLLRSAGDSPGAQRQTTLRVRLLLAPDGGLSVETALLQTPSGMPSGHLPPVAPVPVALAATPVWSADPWLRHKTTRRSVYDTRRVTDAEVFDTLLWNERGELTEFTIGNLVLDLDGALVTPPVRCGLLPGTLRAEVLEHGVEGRPVIERVVTRTDLDRAQSVWLINAVRGWVLVSVIDCESVAVLR